MSASNVPPSPMSVSSAGSAFEQMGLSSPSSAGKSALSSLLQTEIDSVDSFEKQFVVEIQGMRLEHLSGDRKGFVLELGRELACPKTWADFCDRVFFLDRCLHLIIHDPHSERWHQLKERIALAVRAQFPTAGEGDSAKRKVFELGLAHLVSANVTKMNFRAT